VIYKPFLPFFWSLGTHLMYRGAYPCSGLGLYQPYVGVLARKALFPMPLSSGQVPGEYPISCWQLMHCPF